MSGEPTTSTSEQNIPKWAANASIIAAGICLITSLWLAITDEVGAGTLTAGLFVVCVLFVYLPKMESFKAYGIEAKWRAVVKETGEAARQTDAALKMLRTELKEIKNQIATGAPKEVLATKVEKFEMGLTQASTANNAVSATISVLDPTFRATKKSN
jgi:ABC-type transport system involved in cytochrome bd biosynthesis fused ATPase/permease subunit